MDLTPPSLTTSPLSPRQRLATPPSFSNYSACPSESPAASYPSPSLLDPCSEVPSPYGSIESCSLPQELNTTAPVSPLGRWTPSDMASMSPPGSASSAISNILSAEYGPFANYDSSFSATFSNHDAYHQTHTAATSLLRTPSLTGASTSRSSSMATRSSFSYLPDHLSSESKTDTASTFSGALEPSPYVVPGTSLPPYGPSTVHFPAHSSPYLADEPMASWPRDEFHAGQLGLSASTQTLPSLHIAYSSHNLPTSHVQGQAHSDPESDGAQRWKRPTRTRGPTRKHTTPEEANFQCMVKGCGKLFSRSYNFKSHMETHDEKREYPFPCPIGGCTRKFVRKTDLQRHHQSVHMKERNHKCDYCGRLFARKDTLRRHMEDGCSKRFDIGTLNLREEGYGSITPVKRSGHPKDSQAASGPGTLAPPLHMLPPSTGSRMTALGNRGLVNGGYPMTHGHSWPPNGE